MASQPEREPTEQEVDREIRRLMEVLTAHPYSSHLNGQTQIRGSAAAKLRSQGYITDPFLPQGAAAFATWPPFYLTPTGWEYWEKLRLGPELYWLERNWLPVAVALFAGITAIVNIVVLLTR